MFRQWPSSFGLESTIMLSVFVDSTSIYGGPAVCLELELSGRQNRYGSCLHGPYLWGCGEMGNKAAGALGRRIPDPDEGGNRAGGWGRTEDAAFSFWDQGWGFATSSGGASQMDMEMAVAHQQ